VSFDPNRPAAPEPFSPVPPEPSSVPTMPVAPSPVGAAPAILPAARKKSSGGWLNVVLIIAAAVAIGGVAFAVGRTTAPVAATTGNGRGNFGGTGFPGASFLPRGSGAPGLGRGGFGGGFGGAGVTVSGTVQSVDGDTLTIKTAAGQTITVTTGSSTTYHTQSSATSSDVQAGKSVQVQLDFAGGGGRPNASGAPDASGAPGGATGTASSVTIVP